MRNQTDMMRQILTNETAQKIIDYVSPIYGNSYVGLWIYQSIGVVLGEVCEIADKLRDETNPATADLLLDYWEDHYKIARDSNLTTEQRRQRILSKLQSRGGCTPSRLSGAVSSALGGPPVEIEENADKNTFLVTIQGPYGDIAPAVSVIERTKPAHLIYRIQSQIEEKAPLSVACAITHAEHFVINGACRFYETVDTEISTAYAITHAEKYTIGGVE